MRSFSDYRKSKIEKNFKNLSTQERLQGLFETFKIDLYDNCKLPESISENIGLNSEYIRSKVEEKDAVSFVVESICNHGKRHGYKFLVEDATTLSVDNAKMAVEKINKEVKKQIEKMIDDPNDGLRAILKQAFAQQPQQAPETSQSSPNSQTGGGGSTAPNTNNTPQNQNQPQGGVAQGTPTNANQGGNGYEVQPWNRPRGGDAADYGSIRPKDGFWKGIRRAVIDPFMKWGPIKKFRQRWHNDPTRESLEYFDEVLLERVIDIDQIVDQFKAKLMQWVDDNIAKIANDAGIPVNRPAPVQAPVDDNEPASVDSDEEVESIPADEEQEKIEAVSKAKRSRMIKQAQRAGKEALGIEDELTGGGRVSYNATLPKIIKAIDEQDIELPRNLQRLVDQFNGTRVGKRKKEIIVGLARELGVPSSSKKKIVNALYLAVGKSQGFEIPDAIEDEVPSNGGEAQDDPVSADPVDNVDSIDGDDQDNVSDEPEVPVKKNRPGGSVSDRMLDSAKEKQQIDLSDVPDSADSADSADSSNANDSEEEDLQNSFTAQWGRKYLSDNGYIEKYDYQGIARAFGEDDWKGVLELFDEFEKGTVAKEDFIASLGMMEDDFRKAKEEWDSELKRDKLNSYDDFRTQEPASVEEPEKDDSEEKASSEFTEEEYKTIFAQKALRDLRTWANDRMNNEKKDDASDSLSSASSILGIDFPELSWDQIPKITQMLKDPASNGPSDLLDRFENQNSEGEEDVVEDPESNSKSEFDDELAAQYAAADATQNKPVKRTQGLGRFVK